MGTITLNEKQRRRCKVITRLIANKISSSEASELLGVTDRQVRRIRRRYEASNVRLDLGTNKLPERQINGSSYTPRPLLILTAATKRHKAASKSTQMNVDVSNLQA
jgi:hypothetical protein